MFDSEDDERYSERIDYPDSNALVCQQELASANTACKDYYYLNERIFNDCIKSKMIQSQMYGACRKAEIKLFDIVN